MEKLYKVNDEDCIDCAARTNNIRCRMSGITEDEIYYKISGRTYAFIGDGFECNKMVEVITE